MFFIRENIIRTFKKGIFPYVDWFQVEKESDEESGEKIDTTDIPDLETQTSTAKKRNQQGQGLKILTPSA